MAQTVAETVAVMMAVLVRLTSSMRGSITFDDDTTLPRHSLPRGLRGATSYFCDVCTSWQMGDIQEVAMTPDLTPRKCLGFEPSIQAFLAELGKKVDISFHRTVALRA